MESGKRTFIGLILVSILGGLVFTGVIASSQSENVADQFYMGNGQYDVFAAANYAMNKSVEDCSDVITKEDIHDAVETVSRQIDATMELNEKIVNEIKEDGIPETLLYLTKDMVSNESEVSSFDWLIDYNNDGVKDLLDYNIWKQIYLERAE